jgi:hypothetical protein
MKEDGRSNVYVALLMDEITDVSDVLFREPGGKGIT